MHKQCLRKHVVWPKGVAGAVEAYAECRTTYWVWWRSELALDMARGVPASNYKVSEERRE
jgi:hypothetical protein